MILIEQVGVSADMNKSLFSSIFDIICANEGFGLGDVSIIIGTDDWLLEFNKTYLNHDFYTDIITFDYVESSIISGDLLISLDRVYENADDMNVSRETELNRVVIHGFLHLCGYSDKSDEEREIMRKKEDYYLKLL